MPPSASPRREQTLQTAQLTNRNLCLPVPAAGKSKIKVASGLVSEESCLSGLYMAIFLPRPHPAFPLCAPVEGGRRRESELWFSLS